MEVISYENVKGIVTVGFKENSFVVYSSVSFIDDESKERLLQRAYKQIKSTIEYEIAQNDHSFITDEIGDSFIPDKPFAEQIEIEKINPIVFTEKQEEASVSLKANIYDQYGDKYDSTIEWSVSEGLITGNELTLNPPKETHTIILNAVAEDLVAETELVVYPYIETVTVKPVEDEISDLRLEMARGNSELFETLIMLTGGGM